ncbi:MAG: peptide-methionine (R)-S-oxide reductase, partial [Nitrosomonadales bacterium]|nr:peptide-methionine (R)-S-oxide reductase [Nitrosomonadales bacterium]MBT7482096.1 peptide-methionine (R)-S-oxide reductase [Nitrosomonadales bacterium]
KKYDSQSGWPSFTEPIKENSIAYKADTKRLMIRVEIICNICEAHLGHVFPDGPEPSKLRYCVNALSLKRKKY